MIGPDGEPVRDAILHVWHANSQGWYCISIRPVNQTPFN